MIVRLEARQTRVGPRDLAVLLSGFILSGRRGGDLKEASAVSVTQSCCCDALVSGLSALVGLRFPGPWTSPDGACSRALR